MAKMSSPATYIKDRIVSPIKEFIHDSRAVGITLIACTIISLILSNSPWSEEYIGFWNSELIHATSPRVHLPHSIIHIINDALMAVFFFLVGLEIKRELLVGELASIKKSALPVIGAVGGMTIPALIFLAWTWGSPLSRGWGIPMATDIAFSLGVLSMLGKRTPFSLRVFLMALAIIDDLGGIVTIAIFYAETINWTYLFMAGGLLFVLSLLNILKMKRYYIYFIFGIFLWYFFFNSGVHATIAGVLLAFTIPLHKIEDLIHSLHDPVNFIILPLFALANTTIVFPSDFAPIYASIVHWGVFTGLVAGKPIGIFLFSWLAVKFKIAALPKGMNWYQLIGMGMIAGIGFTMSIFMATLAYKLPEIQVIAKVGILGASLVAGLTGFLFIYRLCKNAAVVEEEE
ncbi:MAG: Na+/H+ antiporter NhaA [Flavipsychrobacter sp.]